MNPWHPGQSTAAMWLILGVWAVKIWPKGVQRFICQHGDRSRSISSCPTWNILILIMKLIKCWISKQNNNNNKIVIWSRVCGYVGCSISQHYKTKYMNWWRSNRIFTQHTWQHPEHICKYFYSTTTINQLHLHMYRILFRIPIQNISWLIKWSDLCGVGSWERLMHTPCLSLVWTNICTKYYFWIS